MGAQVRYQTGEELLDYLRHRMSPTTYSQPLIIGELIKRGGTASQRELAEALMIGDEAEVKRWESKVLGRWPRATLRKHGVVHFDPKAMIRVAFCELGLGAVWLEVRR